jgi:glutamate/tyrosine decarboxylase-like PLP-dependent enzyme
MYLTRHPGLLERTFRTTTAYMPAEARALAVEDPYARSMQWSRRFAGLKLFLTLMVAGWDGMTNAIRRSVALGGTLRDALVAAGWQLANSTPLPVVCFRDRAPRDLSAIVERVLASGRAWISMTTLAGAPALRACISNFRPSSDDVTALIAELGVVPEEATAR